MELLVLWEEEEEEKEEWEEMEMLILPLEEPAIWCFNMVQFWWKWDHPSIHPCQCRINNWQKLGWLWLSMLAFASMGSPPLCAQPLQLKPDTVICCTAVRLIGCRGGWNLDEEDEQEEGGWRLWCSTLRVVAVSVMWEGLREVSGSVGLSLVKSSRYAGVLESVCWCIRKGVNSHDSLLELECWCFWVGVF